MLTPPRNMSLLLLMLSCFLISACTLGPRTRTEYVIVGVGKPIVIVGNVTALGKRLDTAEESAPVKQNISGWVAMPMEHFEALKRAAMKGQP